MAAETKIVITAATAQAQTALRTFGQELTGVTGRLSSFVGIAGTLGGALSLTAFAGFIKQSIDAADHLNDLAQKTGTSVEALAGLKFAADQNGTSLEAVANASKKLATNLADQPDTFKKFGITAKDSTGALIQLADIFAAMPDGVEKTALAVKLMGKSGEEMIPFLNQGSEALRRLADEGKRLNPVTAEMAALADQVKDDMAALKMQGQGLGVTLAAQMLPQFTEITAAMKQAATESGLLMAAWVGLGGVAKAIFTDDLLTRQQKIRKEIASLQSGMDDRNIGDHGRKAIQDKVALLQKKLEGLTPKAPEAAPKSDGKGRALYGALGGDGKKKKQQPFDPEGDFWFAVEEAQTKNRKKAAEDFNRDYARSVEEANRIIFDIDPIARATAEWEKLLELKNLGLLTDEQIAASYSKTFGGVVEATKEATDQMTVFAEQAGRNIQDAFAEFLFDPFKGGLNGMLDGFQVMLRKMAAEALASSALNALGIWGKTGGGAGSFLGNIVAAAFPAKALGGPVSGGTAYLVGERGPEIFTPAVSGNITPNDKIGRSVTVVNNFHLAQPADRRTQEQVAALAGASIQRAMMRSA